MSVEGIIIHHGEAHGVTLHQTRVDYLVNSARFLSLRSRQDLIRARTITRSRRFSTFLKESSICVAVNAHFGAGRELACLYRQGQLTRSETPVRRLVGCSSLPHRLDTRSILTNYAT